MLVLLYKRISQFSKREIPPFNKEENPLIPTWVKVIVILAISFVIYQKAVAPDTNLPNQEPTEKVLKTEYSKEFFEARYNQYLSKIKSEIDNLDSLNNQDFPDSRLKEEVKTINQELQILSQKIETERQTLQVEGLDQKTAIDKIEAAENEVDNVVKKAKNLNATLDKITQLQPVLDKAKIVAKESKNDQNLVDFYNQLQAELKALSSLEKDTSDYNPNSQTIELINQKYQEIADSKIGEYKWRLSFANRLF